LGSERESEALAKNPVALVVVDSALSFLDGDENSASDVKQFCADRRSNHEREIVGRCETAHQKVGTGGARS